MNEVIVSKQRGVVELRLNQAERRNSLSFELLAALEKSLKEAARDRQTRAVLLAAEPPTFCAGMDLRNCDISNARIAKKFARALATVYQLLLTFPVPVLCAVDGAVRGGGMGLVAASNMIWGGPGASFAMPETRLGVVSALVSIPLAQRINSGKLAWLVLSAAEMNASEAYHLGLVDVVTANPAIEAARQHAQRLVVDQSDYALRRTKAFLLGASANEKLKRQFASAEKEFLKVAASPAARHGVTSFLEKKPIRWDAQGDDVA